MTDENDAQSPRLEFAQHGEEMLDLVRVQARGRLVQHQRPGVDVERAGDGHHLLYGDGITVQWLRHVHFKIEPPQRLGGAKVDLIPVDATKLQRLAAKKNIFRHGRKRDQVDLLVNRADAQPLRLGRRTRIDGTPVKKELAAVAAACAGEHFDQCAFTGAVLAHQRVDFTPAQREINPVQGAHAGESFRDATSRKQGRGGGHVAGGRIHAAVRGISSGNMER